ncbi:MAG: glutamate racemase [Arenicella sp.]
MAKVLVFDSGVGGLTIFQAIRAKLPWAELIFASDNAAYPYGKKSEQVIINRVATVSSELVTEHKPDILVVACNTASTVVLPSLRQQLNIPVVGVVPAIKPAARLTRSGHIGILATPATVKRQYTRDLIAQFANQCQVSLLGSSELVDLAECKMHKNQIDTDSLAKVLEPWLEDKHSKMDTIVLACTHFPLLQTELNQLFEAIGKDIQWVDSALGIANRTEQLLLEVNAMADREYIGNVSAVMTMKQTLSEEFLRYIEKLGVEKVEVADIEFSQGLAAQ